MGGVERQGAEIDARIEVQGWGVGRVYPPPHWG